MSERVSNKKVINLKLEATSKFMTWMFDKHLNYGDWFEEWWKAEGLKAFMEWSKIKAIDTIKKSNKLKNDKKVRTRPAN